MSRRALVEIVSLLLLLFAAAFAAWAAWSLVKVPLYDSFHLREGVRLFLEKGAIATAFLAAAIAFGTLEELYADLEARRWAAGTLDLPEGTEVEPEDDDAEAPDEADEEEGEPEAEAETLAAAPRPSDTARVPRPH